jgi:Domain of unknown function (DUF4412)
MTRSLATLALALLPFAGPTPARAQSSSFEGVIVATMYTGDKPMEMTTRYKGSMARMEIPMGPAGGAYQLLDLGKGTMTAVMPAQKMFITMDLNATRDAMADKADKATPPKVTATGKTETIAGHSCAHYLIESEDGRMDVCAATGMGYLGTTGANPMARGRAPAAIPLKFQELYARFKDGFQPLKVERLEGDKRILMLQVESIEKGPQDADLFKVPAGFRDMSGMMRGRMPGAKPPRG